MKRKTSFLKLAVWFLGLAAITFLALICLIVCGPRLKAYFERVRFDSSRWQAHLKDHDSVKLKMVDDLLSQYSLVGMTRTQIQALLGTPPALKSAAEADYVYWLGPERSLFAIDSEWLAIRFENDVVTKANVVKD